MLTFYFPLKNLKLVFILSLKKKNLCGFSHSHLLIILLKFFILKNILFKQKLYHLYKSKTILLYLLSSLRKLLLLKPSLCPVPSCKPLVSSPSYSTKVSLKNILINFACFSNFTYMVMNCIFKSFFFCLLNMMFKRLMGLITFNCSYHE